MQAGPEPSFMLNGGTLATIGTIIGALCGALVFLTRQLIGTKDAIIEANRVEIKRLEQQLELLYRQRAAETELLRAERDYFREVALKNVDANDSG